MISPLFTGDAFRVVREKMVIEHIVARGMRDAAVLAAMRSVPRHLFVSKEQQSHAYDDSPLPIGHGQSISQPYIVALITALAQVRPGMRVLEIGSGCGYQTAVLAEMGAEVFSIEIVGELAERSAKTLEELGYRNVHVHTGDGYAGWPEHAPFGAIVLAAAPNRVPAPLLEQLDIGGRLVMPEGVAEQMLRVYTRESSGFSVRDIIGVRFVPMTGKAQEH